MFTTQLTETHQNALKSYVDSRGWIEADSSDISKYNQSARHGGGKAAAVIRPQTSAEVSKILAYCVEAGIRVVPQSGNTGLVWGSVTDNSCTQLLMSLERLKSLSIDPTNRTATVGAGLRLSSLNTALAESGLTYPIDLSSDPCLGGMIATNTGGSRLLKYGDVRQSILGLTVVLADEQGTVIELGRGLRKDNVGVDWKQLFIGSSGAFAVITAAEIALEMAPSQQAAVLLVPADYNAVPELLLAMERQFGDCLTAFEGMSKAALTSGLDYSNTLRNPFQSEIPEYVILAEISRHHLPYEGEVEIEQWLALGLEDIFTRDEGLLEDAIFGNYQQLWALRHGLSEGVQNSGYLVPFDLSFRRGDAMRFIAEVEGELSQRFTGVRLCHFGHIGDGGVHLNFVIENEIDAEHKQQITTELRAWIFAKTVEEFGGSFSAEHGIGRSNEDIYQRYTGDISKRWADGFSKLSSQKWLGNINLGSRDSDNE